VIAMFWPIMIVVGGGFNPGGDGGGAL
jgi:hypothetical protein